MKLHVRTGLFVVLMACGIFFSYRLHNIFTHRSGPMRAPGKATNALAVLALSNAVAGAGNASANSTNTSPETTSNASVSITAPPAVSNETSPESIEQFRPSGSWFAGMVTYGALLFGVVVGLGLLIAREVSHFTAHQVQEFLFNDDGVGIRSRDYEEAEELWKRGEYLEAVQLMRDYYKRNPREVYVALRIAEIYEKDLNNPLAAALEYEEVLKMQLPADRWGWAAIHLSNIYTGKLNKVPQALELLQRIVAECGETPPARKARERLQALRAEHPEVAALPAKPPDQPPPETPPAQDQPQGQKLPPGFRPLGS